MKKITTILLNLLVAIMGGGVMVYCFFSWQGVVLALTNNYTKSDLASPPDNQITSTEWNNLLSDFVNQNGDVMAGNLDMNGHSITSLSDPTSNGDLANRQWTENAVTSAYTTFLAGAQDRDGHPLYIVCGQSSSPWVPYGISNIYIDVDTTNGGTAVFSSTPYYFISLGGDDRHFEPTGQSSVYFPIAIPSNQGFRVYINEDSVTPNITALQANGMHWHINWCGVGTIY